jgi:uncharacterized protein YoxC
MDNTFLPLAVHEEYAKRMEAEHKTQNRRIKDLEDSVKDISNLTNSVASLAKSVEQMAKTQEKQGKRLEELEQKPAKRWESFVEKAVWAVVAALITFVLSYLGLT